MALTTRARRIIVLSIVTLLIGAGWIWFAPVGTGEYADSPDGKYTAHASALRRGTFFQGRITYVEIEIVERSTKRTIWRAERRPAAGETPPDFGDRSRKFIVWAPDSRSVSIPVGGPADAVWVVP